MHNSLDICYGIAEKLRDPQKVSQLMMEKVQEREFFQNEWPKLSLVEGVAGIICFYAMMDRNFENEGWDGVAHDYITSTKECLESVDFIDTSLFYGLAGLSYATHLCSDNGRRYVKMISKFDDLLIQEIQTRFLDRLEDCLNPHIQVPSYYYNLANGLSGIIAYLLYRQNFTELTRLCVDCLVKVLSVPRTIDSQQVAPWVISSQSPDYYEIEEPYKLGYYQLTVTHGIPGTLGLLSQIALKGIKVDGLNELIAKLAEWVKSKQTIKNHLVYWKPIVPLEDHVVEEEDADGAYRNIATPGVARCLYLASKALLNRELDTYSQNVILSHLSLSPQWLDSTDSSFSMGKAGLLSLAYQMGCETEKPIYFKIAKEIEEEVKRSYHPSNTFGFRSISTHSKDKIEWIDSPGLFNGAVGAGLSLLEVQGRVRIPWHQVFLIT